VDKKALRFEIKQKLKTLTIEEIESKSSKLSLNLLQLLEQISRQKGFRSLGCFNPIQQEPLWFLRFKPDAYDYLLVHMHLDQTLSFHPVEFEGFDHKVFHLELHESLLVHSGTPEVLLVPGLAFTQKGERLGRGKAYFDKYLSSFKGVTIGLGFEMQVVKELQTEAHDMKLDYIVTEKDIYKGNIK
tara:strand:- start:14808 stop:15365 length:558 start_codon:yes stop_codon:yes gene_type:complete